MSSVVFSEKELSWLTSLLREHVCNDLYLVDERDLCIKYADELLNLDFDDFRRLALPTLQAQEITLYEIFDLIFKCLTRQEEYLCITKDIHDRFPARASSAHQSHFLERPVVDECFELIRQAVRRQWPQLKLKELKPETIVTCDVDNPYEFYTLSQQAFIKKLGGDLLKRKSFREFSQTWRNYHRTARGDYSADPNNTFDWMMDVNEKAGNRMAFYFLVDNTVPMLDAHYSIDEPRIRQLMRRIYDRGHEVGLHASYGTFKNSVQMKKEADKLRQVMDEEGIKQDEIGSRQHYLRWSTPETARHLEAAGIAYDSTLGYADHAGFRCGTSHEFPMFDIENQKVLNLRQRPLIMMEASVLNAKYMNKGYSLDTLNYLKSLKRICHRYGGAFTMLWHNSHFLNEQDKALYQELISS